MASPREALRLATLDVHERLHEAEAFGRIARGTLDIPGYVALLGSIFRIHAAVEPVLAGCLETAKLANGDRLTLLRQDLDALGAAAPATAPRLQAPEGADAAIGCLYVVQGSAIGGRVIHRQLDYLFGATLAGRTFFAGSPQDGRRWQRVRALIEDNRAAPERLERMIEGAQAAFALFEACLEPSPKRTYVAIQAT